jgi:hypothetical protein
MPSIVETIVGTAPVNTTTNFSVTTALVPSDVVVVVASRGSGSPQTIISGLGGTWNVAFNKTANTRAQAHWTTGRTGSGTVSVQVASTIEQSRIVIYVLRGLNVSALTTASYSTWNNTGGDDITPTVNFREGQLALGVAISSNPGTATFPFSETPSAGWSVDDAFTGAPSLFTAHRIATSGDTTARIGISNGGNFNGAAVLVFGAPVAQPAAPVPGEPVVIERKLVELPASTTTSFGLDTLLDPTDIVIISMYHNQIVDPTLTFGTLTNNYRLVNQRRINAYDHYATWSYGGSGATTLTINPNNTATEAFIYVIRGTKTRTLEYNLQTGYGAASVVASKSTLTGEARPGQMAILIGLREGGVTSTNITGAGSSGWVKDNDTALFAYSQAITAETALQATINVTPSGYLGGALLVFGEAAVREPTPDATIVYRKEVKHNVSVSGSNAVFDLGFDVQATDVVVFVAYKGSSGSVISITPDAASWNSILSSVSTWPLQLVDDSGSYATEHAIWAIRGVSGNTNLTAAFSLSGSGGVVQTFVIRGLKDLSPYKAISSGISTLKTTDAVSAPDLEIGAGNVVVGMAYHTNGAAMTAGRVVPASSVTPWTTESFATTAETTAPTRAMILSQEPTSDETQNLRYVLAPEVNMYAGTMLFAFGERGSADSAYIGWGMPI